MVAHWQTSEKVLDQRPRVMVGKGKEVMAARHRLLFKELSSSSDLVVYTDRSKSSEGAGVAWTVFVRGQVTGAGGCAVPSSWSIVECELFAAVCALRACRSSARGRPVHLFLDCVPALILIENMMSDGDSAEMWEVMVPLLNEFTSVSFGWVPGHMGVLGNEAVDRRAKSSIRQQLRPVLWDGISFRIGHTALARELRKGVGGLGR